MLLQSMGIEFDDKDDLLDGLTENYADSSSSSDRTSRLTS